MKTKKYVPTCCRGDDAEWTGSIELKPLGIEEKMELIAEQGIDVEVGEDGSEKINKGKGGNVAFLVKCIRNAKGKYVSVDIKNKKTDEKYESYEDLDSDDLGHKIITEVATGMLNGYKVGNG